MRFLGSGLDFAGGVNLQVVLTNGDIIQGTFLGIIGPGHNNFGTNNNFDCNSLGSKHITNPLLPLIGAPVSPFIGNPNIQLNDEFILLQLTCAYNGFVAGNLVAINTDNIATIGPSSNTCI
ncbi:hypothetical protein P22_3494 [Propionispora sp. 2/2-37]|uniref:hypothetical protein n=1 Tax=Propionispora sp. 2/2-37 TaxID=1677858 RepID=UPI0006BB93ED|nr:hypothetical protein [Propionispora sp. 2/2-37]CUH97366.1 hypothetical protein P22_3494 [Propionispora sp. 2/2-37]